MVAAEDRRPEDAVTQLVVKSLRDQEVIQAPETEEKKS